MGCQLGNLEIGGSLLNVEEKKIEIFPSLGMGCYTGMDSSMVIYGIK